MPNPNLRITTGKDQYEAPIVGGGYGLVTAFGGDVLDGAYVPTQTATDLVNNGKAVTSTLQATWGAITDDKDPVAPAG